MNNAKLQSMMIWHDTKISNSDTRVNDFPSIMIWDFILSVSTIEKKIRSAFVVSYSWTKNSDVALHMFVYFESRRFIVSVSHFWSHQGYVSMLTYLVNFEVGIGLPFQCNMTCDKSVITIEAFQLTFTILSWSFSVA